MFSRAAIFIAAATLGAGTAVSGIELPPLLMPMRPPISTTCTTPGSVATAATRAY
jgi:hypothetical protein